MKIVDLGIWRRDVIFFVWDSKELIDFAKKEKLYNEQDFYIPDNCQWRTFLMNEWFIMCWVKDKNDSWFIAHEIFHCADIILRDLWITLSKDSDEVYAYTIQYLTEEFYKDL